MNVLADTSIWVAYLRHGVAGPAAHLDTLLERGQVMMCGPVAAELIAGVAVGDSAELSSLLRSLPWADLDRDAWLLVGDLAAKLRAQGSAVALTDLEIAVAAAQAGCRLWTTDSDFARVQAVWSSLLRFEPPA